MSFHTYFSFTSGLSCPLKVPKGTKARLVEHIEDVERTLGLKRTRYQQNPIHWDTFDANYREGFPQVSDEVLCETVKTHNAWVRRFYDDLSRWAEQPVDDGEELGPHDADDFWHGLEILTVRPERWTADYYRSRMETLYDVMRGRPCEGIVWDVKALTPRQAASVIRLFEEFLDPADLRLDVPHGHDYLASSYDGGYDWCDQCCRPMAPDDGAACRKRQCPLREED